MLSQKLGWDFYKALRENDTMIVQGHQGVYKTMQQGERVIGAEGSDPRTFNKGKDVPNMSMIYPTEGVFVVCSPVGIVKNATQSERRQAVRAIHAVAGGAEDHRRQRHPFLARRHRAAARVSRRSRTSSSFRSISTTSRRTART